MPDVIINVTPQPTVSVEVDVDNVASYYYDLAKQWAISPNLVEQLDYSSKYYANLSSTSATTAQNAADSILNNAGFIAVSQDLINIDTVATNIANVNTVANNITDINTVAGISSNVTTVASISLDVTAVNNNATNINTCASSASNINTVAGNIANINTVAGDKTNIDTVASISGDITTVAGISTDVTSVASISSAVSAVNTNASNINAVSNDLTNINSVASDLTNIDSVAGDLTNIDNVSHYTATINTVSFYINNVNSVAGNLTNINTVANNITDINTCSTNISNINTCAANISTIGDKVSKTGDTMTGDLNIKKSTYTQYSTSYTEGGYLQVKDKNDNIVGNYMVYSNNNKNYIQMSLYDGSSSTAFFGIGKSNTSNSDIATASSGVKQSITNWAFPSSSYLDLSSTWGASGLTFTTNANVWLLLVVAAGAPNEYIQFNAADGSLDKKSNMLIGSYAPATGYYLYLCMPMSSGQSTKIFYNASGSLFMYGFIYANGG